MSEIPNTVVECDGCGEEMNLLAPYLSVTLKPQHNVLLMEDVPTKNPDEIPGQSFTLGSRKGRGVMWVFHDFNCALEKLSDYKDKVPVLEVHKEDEIYVPEDNRSPEELLESGEMTQEQYDAIDREPAEGGEN